MHGDSILSILDLPPAPLDMAYELANLAQWEADLADATRRGNVPRSNWCADAIRRIKAELKIF